MMGICSTINSELIILKTGIKKQDDYNAWYYKTHKEKWNGINLYKASQNRRSKDEVRQLNKDYEDDRWFANSAKQNADAYEYAKGNRLEREYGYEHVAKPNHETFSEHTRNMRASQHMHENAAYVEKHRLKELSNPKTAGYMSSSNEYIKHITDNIQKDRSIGINMVRYDMHLAAEKISSALNKIKHMKLK